jgi:hypothetical protein
MFSRKEKEEKAKELLKKGMTIRFIAEELKMSFSDIGDLRRQINGVTKEKPLSTTAEAFKLFFLEKKNLVEVAILLNIPTNEVIKIHSEFLLLQNRGRLAEILDKNKDRAVEIIKLNDYLDKNHMHIQRVWKHIDLERKLDNAQLENKGLRDDNLTLTDLNKYWQQEAQKSNRRYQTLLKSVRERQISNTF